MTGNIKAIIIDDERIARQEMLRLLKKHPEIEVVAQAENIEQGDEVIKKHKPDVIFLDIEMPGGTGLTLAEQLNGEIPIVFCTAYDEFAVDAFSLNAIDYLVKPVVPARLADTIAKLSIAENTSEKTSLGDDFKLMVKFIDVMKIIRLGDIIRFESIGNHAAIYTPQGKAYLHSSLNKIEERLSDSCYFRASRTDIIRLDAIGKLELTVSNGLLAYLTDGSQVELSRRQASKLKLQLGFPS
ncbi:two-component system response regulator [Colwellia sp. MT41]|uniref:LytR/AlgR family response regulator transcription factor n=1 Tax=Colwellia sp. MT41 TaxID=58049 RepID=UPI0007179270|nr:response regulator transcription factor [Colwellia sp. MT41]ALO36315.1 two-component system response regulator [Colwellia sp. MT41]